MEINREYPCHPENVQRGRTRRITYLVYHYVGALGGAEANARYYATTPGIGASAHYFVGHAPGAEVYASVPEADTAWHCGRADGKYKHPGCRNANSIGIEMCCHRDAAGEWYLDPETVDKAAELGREIMARYGIPVDRVLRHYDVTGKLCPAPMVKDPAAWEAFKGRLAAREGEDRMSGEELKAMMDGAVEAAKPKVYTDMGGVPKWARGLVERAIKRGVIQGDGAGRLNLTDQDLKVLSMLDVVGLLH